MRRNTRLATVSAALGSGGSPSRTPSPEVTVLKRWMSTSSGIGQKKEAQPVGIKAFSAIADAVGARATTAA